MDSVTAVGRGQSVMPIVEDGIIIDQRDPARSRIASDPDVQRQDRWDRINFRAPVKSRRRENGPENHLDPMRLGKFDHAPDVILNSVEGRRASVPGDVVGAGQDVYDGRTQSDDIGVESAEHLRRRLTADAAIDPVALEELWPARLPSFRDGIAHEYDPVGRRLGERPVRGAIPAEVEGVRRIAPRLCTRIVGDADVGQRGSGWRSVQRCVDQGCRRGTDQESLLHQTSIPRGTSVRNGRAFELGLEAAARRR